MLKFIFFFIVFGFFALTNFLKPDLNLEKEKLIQEVQIDELQKIIVRHKSIPKIQISKSPEGPWYLDHPPLLASTSRIEETLDVIASANILRRIPSSYENWKLFALVDAPSITLKKKGSPPLAIVFGKYRDGGGQYLGMIYEDQKSIYLVDKNLRLNLDYKRWLP